MEIQVGDVQPNVDYVDGSLQFHSYGRNNKTEHNFSHGCHSKVDPQKMAFSGFKDALTDIYKIKNEYGPPKTPLMQKKLKLL